MLKLPLRVKILLHHYLLHIVVNQRHVGLGLVLLSPRFECTHTHLVNLIQNLVIIQLLNQLFVFHLC
jgi:hypothetical protein